MQGILSLQRANISTNEISPQGFIMVAHGFGDLKKRNTIKQHIIAKQNNKGVVYPFQCGTQEH